MPTAGYNLTEILKVGNGGYFFGLPKQTSHAK